MYNEQDLVSFGNFLLARYGVKVYATDGSNRPLYDRQVTHADHCNWTDSLTPVEKRRIENTPAPQFNIDDNCLLQLTRETDYADCPIALVTGVRFTRKKVRYDLQICNDAQGNVTRLYNVESSLCIAFEPGPEVVNPAL